MQQPEQAVERQDPMIELHIQLNRLVRSILLFTHLVLVASLWGQWWRIAVATGVNMLVALLNNVLAHRIFQERPQLTENLRIGINVVGTCLYGHVAYWLSPVWIFLPLNSLWVDGSADLLTRLRLYGFLATVAGFALLDGCAPQVPLTVCALSILIVSLSGARVRLLRATLEQLTQRRDELQRALAELELVHRRAREQERLSSLGMLAAGIAHEVNNPMSFVKSNLHALHAELRSHPELPPGLSEYTTEVLPETLEGVQRVCSIVADLRRFARGDPEALIEYELNEEVRTALRMTQGRMEQHHCTLQVTLEPLLPMLGHPRQISQVVMNLLLNAAQAMKKPGTVSVSTRMDGEDDVVLTVSDTGEGMAPEVLAHLFQPFFTTRPTGEGTGLGLAVAHGIVTSHGGRIRVESEPSRGSTFSIRLPRVPPLKFVSEYAQARSSAPGTPDPDGTRQH